ncbi:MAG: MFS family permease [Rhodothermales bacterium]|jgi:MFS family permease
MLRSLTSRMRPLDRPLTESEVRSGLRNVVRDGMSSQALASLTGSTFLVAYALHYGASNMLIGLLASLPHLSQLAQLPAVLLVRRVGNRRLISVVASTIGRSSWLVIAIVPFFAPPAVSLVVLTLGLLTASLMAAVSNTGWNSWMHELVPSNELGSFFGRRFSMATFTGVVVSMGAAWFIDHLAPDLLGGSQYGYSVTFFVGFLFGLMGIFFVSRIPEPRLRPSEGSLVELVKAPLRDQNFANLVRFLAAWSFALYLATPFFSAYMLTQLEMDLSWVIGLVVMGRIVNIVFLRLWGSFSDSLSNKSVLSVAAPLCLACILGWTFTTLPLKHALTLPLLVLLHVLMGVAMAGITLATGNVSLRLAPKGEAINYLAVSNFIIALAAGIAPIIGGFLADVFVDRELAWAISWTSSGAVLSTEVLSLRKWDFVFLISFVFGLYSLHRLSFVKEEGEVEERVVVHELVAAMGRELREFSTVAAVRNITPIFRLSRAESEGDSEGKGVLSGTPPSE